MTEDLKPVTLDHLRPPAALTYLDQFGRWAPLGDSNPPKLGCGCLPHEPLQLPRKSPAAAAELN